VNFHSADMVADCVASLSHEELREIVIINNSPTAIEIDALSALSSRVRLVRVIEAGNNIGFGAAINRAVSTIDLRDTDRVWLVNPDVLITEEHTARTLSRAIEQGYGIVSPAIITDGSSEQLMWYRGGTIDARHGRTIHWSDGIALSAINMSVEPAAVTFITGAAMMLSGATWNTLGGFREDLFLYWEDAELCLRASDNGIALAVVPAVTVWHKVGATSSTTSKSAAFFYYMNRNRLIVCSERANLRTLLLGAGTTESLRLLARAATNDRSLVKLLAAFRGLFSGIGVALKGSRSNSTAA
jgi:N-acetylglucosaminyl-diphospho-decaprenol L-rhamnosyltransferase